jgi:hypothetical protein
VLGRSERAARMPSVQALCAKLTRTHAIERFTGVHSPRGPGERAVRSTKRPEQQPRIRVQRHLRALGISIRTPILEKIAHRLKKLPIVTSMQRGKAVPKSCG